jgi:hypothetical protein
MTSVHSPWIGALFAIPVVAYLFFLLFDDSILAITLPYFPDEPDKSVGFYRDLLHLAFQEIVWYTGFLFLAWIIWRELVMESFASRHILALSTRFGYPKIIIGISFLVTVLVSYYTLDTFPNSSDEYVYVYQGQTMSEGRLTDKAHPLAIFFHFNHVAQKDGVRVGRFPPGWPIFLAAACYAGVPVYLVNPLLGLISLILFYRLAKMLYSEQVALWSLLVMAISSYFIFTSASFFSHTSCMLMVLAFVYCIYKFRESRSLWYMVLAGFFIGMVITIRYYTAVLIFIPFFFFMVKEYRVKAITIFFWMGLGCFPCLALLLIYNHSITGNFFLPVTMWAYEDESLGFVRGHSLLKGMEHLVRWALMFLYWCSPAMLILYVWFLIKKIRNTSKRWIHPEDYAFLLLTTGYFFYYEIGGNQYGPRFLFEALPFLVLFVTRNVFHQNKKFIIALFIAGFVYAAVKIPVIAYREHKIILDREDPYRLVKSNEVHHAVVLISSRVCMIRPMPVGDLTRNDAEYKNDVLFAFDIPGRNHELFAFYPDRQFYRYVRDKEEQRGRLVKVYRESETP